MPEARNAAQVCRDEREQDGEQFRTDYGTNENGANAFGKCVSEKVSQHDDADDDENEADDNEEAESSA
ncbi:MAG TPA: hypothetical protein VKA89_06945 [Solirubrobacterales bacterium]|nr:hypothetical protein [Solirubrobacterales bacterium]